MANTRSKSVTESSHGQGDEFSTIKSDFEAYKLANNERLDAIEAKSDARFNGIDSKLDALFNKLVTLGQPAAPTQIEVPDGQGRLSPTINHGKEVQGESSRSEVFEPDIRASPVFPRNNFPMTEADYPQVTTINGERTFRTEVNLAPPNQHQHHEPQWRGPHPGGRPADWNFRGDRRQQPMYPEPRAWEPPIRKLEMPICNGMNVGDWIYRAERYFQVNRLTEREKLNAPLPRRQSTRMVSMEGGATSHSKLGGIP